ACGRDLVGGPVWEIVSTRGEATLAKAYGGAVVAAFDHGLAAFVAGNVGQHDEHADLVGCEVCLHRQSPVAPFRLNSPDSMRRYTVLRETPSCFASCVTLTGTVV